jgi:hypothetical protein
VAWVRGGPEGEQRYRSEYARLDPSNAANTLRMSAELAQKLELEDGELVVYNLAGKDVESHVDVVPPPTTAELLEQVQAEAGEAFARLTPRQIAQRRAALERDHARCIWVPLPVLNLLTAAGTSVVLRDYADAV